MKEKIVNIIWHDEPASIFRPINSQHEEDLTKPNEFGTPVVAESSPLACPLLGDSSRAKFCEEFGTVPNWIA